MAALTAIWRSLAKPIVASLTAVEGHHFAGVFALEMCR
jgi:hypothetical protein